MPLNDKGQKIKKALEEEYGSEEKAEQVLYAGKNKGTFTGIDRKRIRLTTDHMLTLRRLAK